MRVLNDELMPLVRECYDPAFSIRLPMPLKSGRVSRELTLNFGGEEPFR